MTEIVIRTSLLPSRFSEVMRYSREAFDKSNYATLGFNAPQWRAVLRSGMRDRDMRILTAWRGERCVGVLVGMIGPMPWCVGMSATDLVFVADQGGDMLLREFVAWAKGRKCKRIDMAVSDEAARRGYDRLYANAGFKRAGGVYYMQGEM